MALEIVSPSDSARQINRKVRQYLESGSQFVWVVYPETAEVHVHQMIGGRQQVSVPTGDELLAASALFPNWPGIRVADLFA